MYHEKKYSHTTNTAHCTPYAFNVLADSNSALGYIFGTGGFLTWNANVEIFNQIPARGHFFEALAAGRDAGEVYQSVYQYIKLPRSVARLCALTLNSLDIALLRGIPSLILYNVYNFFLW